MLPAFTTAITTASRHQAVMSSAAAKVMTVLPKAVRCRPRSCTMRAITGKAAMLMAMPMNNANDRKWTPCGAKGS